MKVIFAFGSGRVRNKENRMQTKRKYNHIRMSVRDVQKTVISNIRCRLNWSEKMSLAHFK